MTHPTFPSTPGPNFPAKADRQPLLMTVKFGDGYQQETEDGINSRDVGTHDLQWDLLTTDEKDVFEAFLTERGGSGPFLYTIPTSGKTYTFMCPQWQITLVNHDDWSLSATFVRTFEVG